MMMFHKNVYKRKGFFYIIKKEFKMFLSFIVYFFKIFHKRIFSNKHIIFHKIQRNSHYI